MNRKFIVYGILVLLPLLLWFNEARPADIATLVMGSPPIGSVKRDSTTVWTDDDLTAAGGLFNGALITIKGYPDSLGLKHNATVSGLTSAYFEMSSAWPYGDLTTAKIVLRDPIVAYGSNGIMEFRYTSTDSLYSYYTAALDSSQIAPASIATDDLSRLMYLKMQTAYTPLPDTTGFLGGEMWWSTGDTLYVYKSDHTIGVIFP
jgi:hypothetical protein